MAKIRSLEQKQICRGLLMHILDKYIPVMSPSELTELCKGALMVDDEMVDRWEILLADKQKKDVERKIKTAYAKQR